ncbi:hypothetical protein MCOR04_005855 [Pyricularia oryzae]|uniref:Uncharacterized protein n=1 Tax=Pyricularia oryzae TaxID=318829 RepID=A0A4P7NKR9_PYROR|nr:hypothetical protein MCOR04_005855 [Pyricularia oryzae]QBZ62640.1 hypothetical protein PoMZ_11523 [Pyricularia oryzae]
MDMKLAQHLPLYMSPLTLQMILVWLNSVEAGRPPAGPERDGAQDEHDSWGRGCSSTPGKPARCPDIGPAPTRLPPPPVAGPRRFELSPSRAPAIPSKNPARFERRPGRRWT